MRIAANAVRDDHACPVEAISSAYLGFAGGDAGIALRCAIADALSDLMEAERRTRERSRLISRGYVREAPDPARNPAS
ncbi:hypothetical protein MKK84_04910 [Methylobacterium sp. E-065]|uniref:hypothetical protein n=1 Tax=Methylobacterium sp. E-065 TaxID=2836583 RepID=UPI001FBB9D62|nr:hypothetical protein [Methylobacterium sp. E-065]MCJ2016773.1 hypothetical protein [Methylobacterium sp. E-065]